MKIVKPCKERDFFHDYCTLQKSCPSARHDGVSDKGGTSPCILNPTRDGGKWPASRPNRFNLGERNRGTDYKDCTVGTVPEPVWVLLGREKPTVPAESRRTIPLLA